MFHSPGAPGQREAENLLFFLSFFLFLCATQKTAGIANNHPLGNANV